MWWAQLLNNIAALLAGGAAASAASFDSFATVTVGAGGAANIEFTSIPSTYTHLQIRGIIRSTTVATGTDDMWITFNSDTGSNYAYHVLQGNGSAASAGAGATQAKIVIGNSIIRASSTASAFSAGVIDILDYKNTNKYKTLRALNGTDANTADTAFRMLFTSGLWQNTNAITSIKLFLASKQSFS